ncbi:MAG: hypothetical protein LBU77_01090, partial [Clostridiales bacterium]|nr:hypothetical protein [Clostridiales bacterium]
MARSSIKNNRNASGLNHVEYGLFKKWGAMIAPIDQLTVEKMNGLLKFTKRLIGDQIYLKSMTDSRLSAYDEKIYVCYDRLMACYRVIVEIYKENRLLFSDMHIKNIYDGLFDIIWSRTKAYEEISALRVMIGSETTSPASANPIALEKNEIIYESLRDFGREFDQKAHQFKTEKQREILLHARERLLSDMSAETDAQLSDDLRNTIESVCGGVFFDLFDDAVKMTILHLNDLEKRKTVAYFFDLLSREHDILRNIITVQAGALETYILAGAEDEQTIAVIQLVLKNLREIYQHYGKETDEILATHRAGVSARKEPGETETALSGEGFIGGLFDVARKEIEDTAAFVAVKDKFETAEKTLAAAFYNAVKNTFDAVIQANNSLKEQYALKKVFSQTEIMADQMTAAFEYILNDYATHKEILLEDTENSEIIAGIAETIEIKIESIRENKTAFIAAAEKKLSEAAKTQPEIPPEEIAAAAEKCYETVADELKTLGRDDRRGIGAALIKR